MHPSRLGNVVAAASLAVADAVRVAVERQAGVGGGAAAALVTLAAFPGRPQRELVSALGLSQPGAARLLDQLVARGLVLRERGGGRELALALSDAGEEAARRVLAARAAAVDALLAPLSTAERDALVEPLARLLEARAARGRDPRHVCRLCDRDACEACPAERGDAEAGAAAC
jgi:DNA-binding MarR family transcriptional regulator